MLYTKEKILNLASDLIKSDNILGNPNYKWLDFLGIPQRPDDLKSSLYFATYSDGNDGWHNTFDRRATAQKVAEDKGWHLAIEEGVEIKGDHIVVSSLTDLSQRIYRDARTKSNPYIIGVTGSVGKTTTVAFIEYLLRCSGFEVTRFWSKRLTPLLVQCHYVNRVNPETNFVVMEYSAFLRDHVGDLATLLPPNIAFLTNIYNEHVEEGLFRDQQDIFNSKIRIKPPGMRGLVNDKILSELQIKTPQEWETFSVDQQFIAPNHLLPPTLRTAELHTVGRLLSLELNVPIPTFQQAFSNFIPKEKRVTACSYNNHIIFFDGEATCGSRLWSWFETIDGSTPTLLVDSIDFGEDDINSYKDLLVRIFESDETYVLDTPHNHSHLPIPAHFIPESKFADILKKRVLANTYVVYHKTMASRQPGFDADKYLNQRW